MLQKPTTDRTQSNKFTAQASASTEARRSIVKLIQRVLPGSPATARKKTRKIPGHPPSKPQHTLWEKTEYEFFLGLIPLVTKRRYVAQRSVRSGSVEAFIPAHAFALSLSQSRQYSSRNFHPRK